MPQKKPDAGLQPGDLKTINTTLRRLQDAKEKIPSADKCGVDCADYRQQIDFMIEQFTAIKQEYFKGRG